MVKEDNENFKNSTNVGSVTIIKLIMVIKWDTIVILLENK